MIEKELTSPVDIAHPDGRLVEDAIGWARHPTIFGCRFQPGVSRVVRFNYWCVSDRTCALTLLAADVAGLAGTALISFQDFVARWPVEHAMVTRRGLRMPDTPRGDVVVEGWRFGLSMREEGETMRVTGHARTVLGTRIAVDLTVERPLAHETVNVLVPWNDEQFHFTSKQQALPVRGTLRVGSREHRFSPANDAFACLDFGRGRYPARVEWRWAFASGTRKGRTLGLNLGGNWTDGTGVTESGVVVDGRLHKIHEPLNFSYDERDHMKPWTIRTRTGARVDLTFRPIRERAVKLPLVVAGVELHQLMGSFSGTVVDDLGAELAVDDLIGLCESFRGRW